MLFFPLEVVKERFLKGWRTQFIVAVMTSVLLAGLCGCAKNRMSFKIQSNYNTNDEQPVCIVIRSVNYNNFLTESYQDIAGMVYADPPNPTVIASHIILPGTKEKIEIEIPPKELVGVYSLFKEPDIWKVILRRPFDKKYYIILEHNRIVIKKRGLFD
jgi:hypothetical protein